MRLLTARRVGSDLRYVVHLDESKTIPDPAWRPDPAITVPDPEWEDPGDGSTPPRIVDPAQVAPRVPDPVWVMDETYGAGPRTGSETVPQYTARLTAFEASARREMRALCNERLASMQARGQKPSETGAALAGEGATL